MHSHVHCSIILNSHDKETNCLHQLVSGLKKEYMHTHTHTHTHTDWNIIQPYKRRNSCHLLHHG